MVSGDFYRSIWIRKKKKKDRKKKKTIDDINNAAGVRGRGVFFFNLIVCKKHVSEHSGEMRVRVLLATHYYSSSRLTNNNKSQIININPITYVRQTIQKKKIIAFSSVCHWNVILCRIFLAFWERKKTLYKKKEKK